MALLNSYGRQKLYHVGGIAQPMIVMCLIWWPEGLIVKIVLAKGPGENYHIPPLLYIDDPWGQGGSLSPMGILHYLECSLATVFCTHSVSSSAAWQSFLPNNLTPNTCLARN